MKKVKFEGKLSLNKETIAKLSQAQMDNVKGGKGTLSTCPPPTAVYCKTYITCSGCDCPA